MYVLGNPIIFVDPTGMNHDWFENEITGDVYFNSDMKKGQEGTGAMKGEGWQHMGENGMFDKTDNSSSAGEEISLLSSTSNLSSSTESLINNGDGTYTGEAMYEGNNAKTFMNSVGYSNVPKEYSYLNNYNEVHLSQGDGGVQILTTDNGSKTLEVNSWQYVQSSLYKHSKIISTGSENRTKMTTVPIQYNIMSIDLKRDYYNKTPSILGKAALHSINITAGFTTGDNWKKLFKAIKRK
jgi:hypothetical protein